MLSAPVCAYISDTFFGAVARFLRRTQKKAPIARRPSTPTGIPTPSPILAPVPSPEDASCDDAPLDTPLGPAVLSSDGRSAVPVAVSPVVACETALRCVLVDNTIEVDRILTVTGTAAVAYTIGSSAVNVRSGIAQHVVLTSPRDDQPLRPLSPTYAQHHESGLRQLNIRPVFLVGSMAVSISAEP